MIYVSISTIPQRIKNLNESVKSLLNQTKKPDKIFINIPYKYERFRETVSDNQIPKFDNNVVEKYGATKVSIDDIYDLDVDIYAPCALGATINDDTISRLKCKIVAGGANNVLKDSKKVFKSSCCLSFCV